MGDPKKYIPPCILSHFIKVVENAVVSQMKGIAETYRAQFGFQEGRQIYQVALRVSALLREGIYFIMVLYLSKEYDTVLNALLLEKL